MELWAAIDLMEGSAVTLVQGRADERTVWEESPLQLAKRWQDEGADGLHIIDLDAAFGRGSNAETVRRVIEGSKVPVQVGGGMRSAKVASGWLEAGAARVIVGTLAFSDPAAARGLVETHGAERVVVAADYREGMIVTKGWKESQGIPIVAGARRLEGEGFRNLLTTAVGRDGMRSGPDVATVRELSLATRMKILASGGIRDLRDLVELERAGAQGAIIGRALYEETVSLSEARKKGGMA
ncbi:MAG: 1-(5-phosphoribosyl)-5-[(5-phosphoribosylamino)methylideneamino] imidazole-4-carboxamide isomerase [Thaumarchaeota archaeon]|nr:1-(5-phosphoribosyl)-5-[(5-phosphoribosylamino)methylideneamino] imidazole-4-carboxamide isomerase [Nitrososphaerota archaeon]